MRWRDVGAVWAYVEHESHVRDCATSQSRGWFKLDAPCQEVRRGRGEVCSGEGGLWRRAVGKAGGSRAVAQWGSTSGPDVP